MTTQTDVEEIALSLPGVSRDPNSFLFRVSGKYFAWEYLERVHPKKARVPNPNVLGVRVQDDGMKQDMLAAEPQKFFTTNHYRGFNGVLVTLAEVDHSELEQLVTESWKCVAPKRLVQALAP